MKNNAPAAPKAVRLTTNPLAQKNHLSSMTNEQPVFLSTPKHLLIV
jgi:hypothetical protein